MNVYMSKVSACVPRQGWPKPQKLAELGDKKSVLDFLRDEYNAIADFQRADAPALVAYLTGDKAVRQERVADAFRNQAAMAALEKLHMEVSGATCHDSEWSMYQVDYDVIGDEADLAARAGMKALESMLAAKYDVPKEPRSRNLQPRPRGPKVEVGQRWRTPSGIIVTVTSFEMGSLGPLRAKTQHSEHGIAWRIVWWWSMRLAGDGYCDDYGWYYVGDPLPPQEASCSTAEKPRAPKVEVGQLWRKYCDGGPRPETRGYKDGRVVVVFEGACRAHLEDMVKKVSYEMELTPDGYPEPPERWRLVSDAP